MANTNNNNNNNNDNSNTQNKVLKILGEMGGFFWKLALNIIFDAMGLCRYCIFKYIIPLTLIFLAAYTVYCLVNERSIDEIPFFNDMLENTFDQLYETFIKPFPGIEKYIIGTLGAVEFVRTILDSIFNKGSPDTNNESGGRDGNDTDGNANHTSSNSNNNRHTQITLKQGLYIESWEAVPKYCQINGNKFFQEIDVTIKIVNEHNRKEEVVIESCMLFGADMGYSKMFHSESFDIMALSHKEAKISCPLKITEKEYKNLPKDKFTFQIIGNRKVILRQELTL